jgi:hypothetical protein
MDKAPDSDWRGRDPKWTTNDPWFKWVPTALGIVEEAPIAVMDLPPRVIRGSRDDSDFVSTFRKPGCHFAGILPYPGQFWRVVEPINQNFQSALQRSLVR